VSAAPVLPTSLRQLCGQLVVGGFSSNALPSSFKQALTRGERGGAILFRRNLKGTLLDVLALTRDIAGAAPPHLPPLIAVDQEGGRVTRFGSPVLGLPPMRSLGRLGDASLVRRAARVLGGELRALGFTMDCAPVLDVDTCATNPIIGDRSFSDDASVVAELGAAFAGGLESSGMLACGKHFPGHGDTTKDSHLDLPYVDQPRDRLERVELLPYRQLTAATCSAIMTAHVVYPSLDPALPATLSRPIAHDLLRGELGFDGLLVSDDLEMKAVFDRFPIEESAVLAVRAGCDILLICSREAAFLAQIERSVARGLEARRRCPPRPVSDHELSSAIGGAEAVALARELEDRGAFA